MTSIADDPLLIDHLAWLISEPEVISVLVASVLLPIVAISFRIFRPRPWQWSTLVLWLSGSLLCLLIGLTEWLYLINSSVDRSLHNTYYLKAHLVIVLESAATFLAFAAWYHWMNHWRYAALVVRTHFALTLVGTCLWLAPDTISRVVDPSTLDFPSRLAAMNRASMAGIYMVLIGVVIFSLATFHAIWISTRESK